MLTHIMWTQCTCLLRQKHVLSEHNVCVSHTWEGCDQPDVMMIVGDRKLNLHVCCVNTMCVCVLCEFNSRVLCEHDLCVLRKN